MQKHLTLDDVAVLAQEINRVSELWQASLDFVRARGVVMLSYHSDDASKRDDKGIAAHGFPEDWVCQYIEGNLIQVDPIPMLTRDIHRPFFWSEVGELTTLTPAQSDYLKQMAAANLGDGLAMQVFGPNLRNAYVGMGFGQDKPQITGPQIFELQCAAQITHIRYCELTAERDKSRRQDLSPREKEVLEWIARGKSNSIIAEILGVSRHTVDTMTRRIYDKLGVNDRTTAAIRGLGSGLLRNDRYGVL